MQLETGEIYIMGLKESRECGKEVPEKLQHRNEILAEQCWALITGCNFTKIDK